MPTPTFRVVDGRNVPEQSEPMECDDHINNHIIQDSMDVSTDAVQYTQIADTTDLIMEDANTIKKLVQSAKLKRFMAVKYSEPLTSYAIQLRNPQFD